MDTFSLSLFHGLFPKYVCSGSKVIDRKESGIVPFAGVLCRQLLDFAQSLPNATPIPSPPTNNVAVYAPEDSDETVALEVVEVHDDDKGGVHSRAILPLRRCTNGRSRRAARRCDWCDGLGGGAKWVSWVCVECNKAYCMPTSRNGGRRCLWSMF